MCVVQACKVQGVQALMPQMQNMVTLVRCMGFQFLILQMCAVFFLFPSAIFLNYCSGFGGDFILIFHAKSNWKKKKKKKEESNDNLD